MRALLLFFVSTMPLFANFAGGIATVDLGVFHSEPTVYFEGKRVWVEKGKNGNYLAKVGIPLSAKDKRSLAIEIDEIDTTIAFNIAPKNYPEQRIYLDSDKFVHLSKEDLDRAAAEKELMQQKIATYSDLKNSLDLIRPLKGRISGAFGLQRFFNDEPRQPHGGIDIAAPTGSKVVAAQSGKVILAGDFFFCGKFILLDHGRGFMTLYCHLNKKNVKMGQSVKRGQYIADVGKSGRATGPHLHFSAILNGAFIDPQALFVASTSNKHNQTKAHPKQ